MIVVVLVNANVIVVVSTKKLKNVWKNKRQNNLVAKRKLIKNHKFVTMIVAWLITKVKLYVLNGKNVIVLIAIVVVLANANVTAVISTKKLRNVSKNNKKNAYLKNHVVKKNLR